MISAHDCFKLKDSPITGLGVLSTDDPNFPVSLQLGPFVDIPGDVNKDHGGDFTYVSILKLDGQESITGLKILFNDEPTPDGFIKVPSNLVKGVIELITEVT